MKSRTGPAALTVALLVNVTNSAVFPAGGPNAVSTTASLAPSNAGTTDAQYIANGYGGTNPITAGNIAPAATVTQMAGSLDFGSQLKNLNDGLMVSNGGNLEATGNSTVPVAGSQIKFVLPGTYDIGRIETFTGYQQDRTGQKYSVYTSTDGGATWSAAPLVSVNHGNGDVAGVWSTRRVTVQSSNPGAAIATGVNALRFDFADPDGGSGTAVFNEIAVYRAAPRLQVEEPPGTVLSGNAPATAFDPVLTGAASAARLYTVRNTGSAPLTGLAVEKHGAQAGEFIVTPPAGPLAPGASTTFTVSFAPSAGGARSAQLSVAGTGTPPFLVNLSGFGLGEEVDTDGDGMSDAGEAALSALGFDWQSSQPGLVAALRDNAHRADLFDRGQFDAERAAGRAEVTGNPAAHGLYDSNSIMELRLGGAMVPKEGDAAAVVFQLQATGDLTTQPFTDRGPPATRMVPMPSGKAFLRINAAHPRRRRRLYAGARRAKLGRKEDKI